MNKENAFKNAQKIMDLLAKEGLTLQEANEAVVMTKVFEACRKPQLISRRKPPSQTSQGRQRFPSRRRVHLALQPDF